MLFLFLYFLSLFFCYGLQCPKVDHFSLLTRLLGLLPAFTLSFGKIWAALQKILGTGSFLPRITPMARIEEEPERHELHELSQISERRSEFL